LLLLACASIAYADTSIINVYDANGNLVTGDGRYYEYNDANQLVRVRQGDTITGPVIAEYFYDFSGQRVKKIENGVVTYYVGKHFEKQVSGANEGSTSYYFGDDGERVAKKDPTGNIYYYHLDHLDGINAVTDSAGTIVARTDYLPFGDTRSGSTGSEKYTYTGKEQDKTGLYYFEARYNSPEFRHFTQADIAEPDYADPQDLNRYSYVGNNPLSYVDYDGFKKKKKAKLSKREKWMIAHGVDPDHDKTSLKKAKKLYKEGKKYATASKSKTSTASSSKNKLAGVGPIRGQQLGFCSRQGGTPSNQNYDVPVPVNYEYVSSREALGSAINVGIYLYGGDYVNALKDRMEATYKEGKYYLENAQYVLSGGKEGKFHSAGDISMNNLSAEAGTVVPPVKDIWNVIKYDIEFFIGYPAQ